MSESTLINIQHTKEEQAALLSSFMYFDGMVLDTNKTLGENIEYMREQKPEEWEKMINSKTPAAMTKEEAENVANAILADPELRDLKVVDCTRPTPYYEGPVNACFVNEETKEAIVAYRGTNGEEWLDNGEGFSRESSELQQEALDYLNDVIEQYDLVEKGYDIDVTGHSKGGNKAMYVTLECPDVRNCYSYDGQGFSDEYISQNADKIAEREGKITNYAAENDYVHCLGNSVGTTKWFESDAQGEPNPWAHSPSAFMHFDSDNKMCFNAETQQSDFSQTLNQITLDMMKEPQEEKEQYFEGMMSILQSFKSFDTLYDGQSMPSVGEIYSDAGQIKENVNDAINYIQEGEYFEKNSMMGVILGVAETPMVDSIYKAWAGICGVKDKIVNQNGSFWENAQDIIMAAGHTEQTLKEGIAETMVNQGVDYVQQAGNDIIDAQQEFIKTCA